MNLLIKDHLFIVGGATSGFGKAIAEALLSEGANVIVVARGEDKLRTLYSNHENAELITGDCSISLANASFMVWW
jgi:3-oxoacyl-[acyl-carrier protein] reductase